MFFKNKDSVVLFFLKKNLNRPSFFIFYCVKIKLNVLIEKFNAACEKAQLKYYYLIVTREAMGLYKHEYVQEIYQIPQKKKKVQL